MAGAKPDLQNNEGESLLHIVCKEQDESTAELLLKQYPSLFSLKDKAGNPAIFYALSSKTMLDVMLPYYQPQIVDQSGNTILHVICRQKKNALPLVKKIAHQFPDIELICNENHFLPWHIADIFESKEYFSIY